MTWSSDGQSLFARTKAYQGKPTELVRVNLRTGRRAILRELAPPDRAGFIGVENVVTLERGLAPLLVGTRPPE